MIEIMHVLLSRIGSLIHESSDYGGRCPHGRISHAGDKETQNTATRQRSLNANAKSSPVAPPHAFPQGPKNDTRLRRSYD